MTIIGDSKTDEEIYFESTIPEDELKQYEKTEEEWTAFFNIKVGDEHYKPYDTRQKRDILREAYLRFLQREHEDFIRRGCKVIEEKMPYQRD